MFDQFRVPEDIAIRLDAEDVRMSIQNIFRGLGVPEENANRSADVLVYADLRGIESHGISYMMQWYVLGLKKGWLNAAPECKLIRQGPGECNIGSFER